MIHLRPFFQGARAQLDAVSDDLSAAKDVAWEGAKEAASFVGKSSLYIAGGLLTAPGCGDSFEDAVGQVCDSEFISPNLPPAGLVLQASKDFRGVAIPRLPLNDVDTTLCLLEHVSACSELIDDDDFRSCVEPAEINPSCAVDLPDGSVTSLLLSAGSRLDLPAKNWLIVSDDGEGARLSYLSTREHVLPFCSTEDEQSVAFDCLESRDFTLSCSYDVPAAE